MNETFHGWLRQLQEDRQLWVTANERNNFKRGIWNATVEKYADPSHFVLELLQNAEDAGATTASFRLLADAIEFEHDGRPFERDDIEGITGIGNTTKLDQPKKIGCFGIGFKSVYVVTERPEVHCTIEGERIGFAIRDLVVPELIASPSTSETTLFRLPLSPERSEDTLKQVQTVLAERGAESLLFLNSLRCLRWSAPGTVGSFEVQDQGDVRTLRPERDGETQASSRFLILSRPVARDGVDREYSVKAALRLNAAGDVVAEPLPTKLCVYFETEDPTGLKFRVHGPFQLTDNRANAKRDDPWNGKLISEIAALVAQSLPGLRDRGLLKRGLLEVLPNGNDPLADGWEPVRDEVLRSFRTEPLIPTADGGHACAAQAFRGPADVREAFGDDGLQAFAGKANGRWAAAGLRGRADAFLASAGVAEFGAAEAYTAFQSAFELSIWQPRQSAALKWFDDLADDRLQRLYLVVDGGSRAQRHPALRRLPFVRLENGRAVTPDKARLAPRGKVGEASVSGLEHILVRSALVRPGRGRGPDVDQFLRRCGVTDFAEGDYLQAVLLAAYGSDGTPPRTDDHLRHVRRLLAYHAQTGDASLLKNVRFLRAEGEEGYFCAADIYLGEPFAKSGLDRIYGGRVPGRIRRPLWSGYARIGKQKEFRAMLAAAGVEDRLWIFRVSTSGNPRAHDLYKGFGGTRTTDTGVREDFDIPQLAAILALSDPEVSKMVWATVTSMGSHVMRARWSPNQRYQPNVVPSQLAAKLAATKWISTKEGEFRRPREITAKDLPAGFPLQPAIHWLEAVGFGAEDRQKSEQHQARRRAAEAIGLPHELADRLLALSAEARGVLAGEMLRRIEQGDFTPPEFPQRESQNPQKRAARITDRAQSAPDKAYETRQRSVRTSDGDVSEQARIFLRDQYTNEAGQMVCQACQKEMPFRLTDGEYYFEAVAFIPSALVELIENFLALCPTCSAKWRHALGTSDADLIHALEHSARPSLKAELAGEEATIRFTSVHCDDLRHALQATSSGQIGAADSSEAGASAGATHREAAIQTVSLK
ncbi:MAG: hypothetical protein WBR13_02305 [Allosphingosinicella sp.]